MVLHVMRTDIYGLKVALMVFQSDFEMIVPDHSLKMSLMFLDIVFRPQKLNPL